LSFFIAAVKVNDLGKELQPLASSSIAKFPGKYASFSQYLFNFPQFLPQKTTTFIPLK